MRKGSERPPFPGQAEQEAEAAKKRRCDLEAAFLRGLPFKQQIIDVQDSGSAQEQQQESEQNTLKYQHETDKGAGPEPIKRSRKHTPTKQPSQARTQTTQAETPTTPRPRQDLQSPASSMSVPAAQPTPAAKFYCEAMAHNVTEADQANFDEFIESALSELGLGGAAQQKHNPELPDDKPDDAQETEEQFLARTGEFDTHSKIGVRFMREKDGNPDMKAAYAKCSGWTEKKNFRERWAKDKYKEHKRVKEKTESRDIADIQEAEMLTFGALVNKFGGWQWEPAITGAKSHAAKCAAMGAPWVEKDEMSGLMMFRSLTRKTSDVFNRRWSEMERWQTQTEQSEQDNVETPGAGQAAAQGEEPTGGNGAQAQGKAQGKSKAKGKKKPKGQAAGDQAGGNKTVVKGELTDRDLEITDLVKKAISIKGSFIKNMTSAELLIKRIRTPSRKDAQLLGWANNDDNVGTLENMLVLSTGCSQTSTISS